MKFSIKDFFSKCDQICRKLRIWSHLLKNSLMETSFFVQWNGAKCATYINSTQIYISIKTWNHGTDIMYCFSIIAGLHLLVQSQQWLEN